MKRASVVATILLFSPGVGLCLGCGDEARVIDRAQPSNRARDEPRGNPMLEGPAGCYIGAEMRCDCEIGEADCTQDLGGTWVAEGCASCAD